jgi:type II secretory pathway pseudopilin PulG
MSLRARNHRKHQSGIVLLIVLAAVVIVAALAAALLSTAQAEMQQAKTTRAVTDVRTLAEGATVAAEQAVLVAVANTLPPPANGTMRLGTEDIPWTIAHVGNDSVETDSVGIKTTHQHWLVQSTADVNRYKHTVNRVLDVGLTPIFQFAIFYDRDLELLPGPSMTISGRVHTNSDMYVGVGGGNTLTIKSNYFRSVGDLFRMRKDDGSFTDGSLKIQKTGDTTFPELWSKSQLTAKHVPSVSGYDGNFIGFDANGDGDLNDAGDWTDFAVGSLTTWNGTVQTADQGVKRIEPPSIGSIQRFEVVGSGNGDYTWNGSKNDYDFVGSGNGDARKGRYHANADLVIRDDKAYDAAGNALLLPTGTITSKTFYDAREGKNVTVTEIDMGKLKSSGSFPANGLIYASRSDAKSTQPNGIRLKNGTSLGAPLTVCSEDPVYVLGDYNTVNKQPAAVISDAVNLLSNGWNDTKRKGQLPTAKATTWDFAMITGGDETNGTKYSGGFENLPRFHEKWDGITASFLGAFVKIYASKIAKGQWVYGGDHYTAPIRNWDYDQSFNDATKLPPFTPNVAQVRSTGWWE